MVNLQRGSGVSLLFIFTPKTLTDCWRGLGCLVISLWPDSQPMVRSADHTGRVDSLDTAGVGTFTIRRGK
jgi:hypothetical protein